MTTGTGEPSSDQPAPPPAPTVTTGELRDEDFFALNYAGPAPRRPRSKPWGWMAMVRLTGGTLAALSLASYLCLFFQMPVEALITVVCLSTIAAAIVLVRWEITRATPGIELEGSKDRRATTYRASASRFDSSGVTILDPHAGKSRPNDGD